MRAGSPCLRANFIVSPHRRLPRPRPAPDLPAAPYAYAYAFFAFSSPPVMKDTASRPIGMRIIPA